MPQVSTIHDRLMEWLVLTGPQGSHLPAARYQTFLGHKPDWPTRSRIVWRYQNALSSTTDPTDLARLCPTLPLTEVRAFLRCAPYLPTPRNTARDIWISGATSPSEEADLAAAYGAGFTLQDQWLRFERLETRGQFSAAQRQITRLPPDQQARAGARLAARSNAPNAETLFAALSPSDRADATLVRERLHALRRAGRLDEALSLWDDTAAAEQTADPSPLWSREREGLARALLLAGRPQEACRVADDHTRPPQTPEAQDAAFLTGFIALRSLHDPTRAAEAFSLLTTARSLVTRARGLYWTARALDAAGSAGDAASAYRRAAALPTTFYGQLALAKTTGAPDILTQPAPDFTLALRTALRALPQPAATALTRPDLMLAATELSGLGDFEDARQFLMMMQAESGSDGAQKALVDFAVQLGIHEPDVFAARSLSRHGVALYPEGYPALPSILLDPALPDGLVAAVVRQESSFDPHAQSPAHAIGLLQLLPAAARDVVRRGGLGKLNVSASTLENAPVNLRIGSLYLAQLLDRFGGNVPLAIAAYNAGPRRVDIWLQQQPLPHPLTQDDLLDWIERLPYRETRIYIEHILADTLIYRTLPSHE